MKKIIVLFICLAGLLFFLHLAGQVGVLVRHRSVVNSKYQGWKTFDNAKFGYSLKYPSTWGATTSLSQDGILLFSNPTYLQQRLKNPQTFAKEDYASINATVYTYGAATAGGVLEKDTSIDDFASKNYSDLILPGQYTTLSGNQAVIFLRKRMVLKPEYSAATQNCPMPDNSCYIEDGTTQQIWIRLPKGLLLFEDNYGRTYKNNEVLSKTFQKIIDSVSISN